MIETVVSANMLIGEVMRVKKNHLAPDFPTGNEKRLCIVSGIHGDEVAGQYICYELIRRIKKDFDKLTGIVDVYPFINPMGLEAQYRDVPVFDIDMNTLFPGSKDGTVGEYTAAKVMKDIEGADICVDVHSSSVYIKEIPQVRVNSDVASDLAPYVACMNGCCMDTSVVYGHGGKSCTCPQRDRSQEYGSGVRSCPQDRLRLLEPDSGRTVLSYEEDGNMAGRSRDCT